MAAITIRVDDDTRRALDELAASQDVNLSDVLRAKIDELLGRSMETNPSTHPVSLTKVQRALLVQNQEILAALATDVHDQESHQALATALREGFTSEYYRIFQDIGDELSPENSRLVMDILNMFRVCSYAMKELSDEEREALGEDADLRLTFGGFDGNDALEGHMRAYVEFLVNSGRWQEVAPLIDSRHDYGNSHYPTLPGYRRMLAKYRTVMSRRHEQPGMTGRAAYGLTVDDLKAVAAG